MALDSRTEDPAIVRTSGGYPVLSNQPNNIVHNVATLALYLVDDPTQRNQGVYSLESLERLLQRKMPGITKGQDYIVNTGSLTVSVNCRLMDKLMSLPTLPQGESILQGETLPGHVAKYDQILNFFGVARGMSHDSLRAIFYKGFSKLFSPEDFPRLIPSPVGLYKGSVELRPYYQNLPGGFFLCDELVDALIEVTREQLKNDNYALARFEANVRDIQKHLFLLPSNDYDALELPETDERATYSQDEFFNYFSEKYHSSLSHNERAMYWSILKHHHLLWFQKGDTSYALLSHKRDNAVRIIYEAISTRK